MSNTTPQRAMHALAIFISLFLAPSVVVTAQSTTTNSSTSCFEDPTQYSCITFLMPDDQINAHLTGLCTAMPNMIGCSLWHACTSGQGFGQWCQPMSLYGTICQEMGDMSDCAPYTQLCTTPGSVVGQCQNPGPLPNAPTTAEAVQSVLTMCSTHSMPGCERCTARATCPDPLQTLSDLCLEMPGMAECSKFTEMCTAAAEDSFPALCGGGSSGSGSSGLPPMKMWMHAGTRDILIFKEWVPDSTGQYAGYCIAFITFGVLVQWLKAWRVRLEATWASQQRVACCDTAVCGTSNNNTATIHGIIDDCEIGGGGIIDRPKSSDSGCCEDSDSGGSGAELTTALPRSRTTAAAAAAAAVPSPSSSLVKSRVKKFDFMVPNRSQMLRNSLRSVFTFVIVFIDYLLMLAVMSFNIGIIFSVVGGFALGALLFGHWGERVGAGSAVVSGGIAPDSENDLEVHCMEAGTCHSRYV